MTLTPLILGKGNAGYAIAKSIANLSILHPELGLNPVEWVARGTALTPLRSRYENPVLFIANPHGLHAEAILEAHTAGYAAIVCEKPSCVHPTQAALLADVSSRVAILHVYRHMWGPQMLKSMVQEGRFGDIIAVEGRYWQASAAERALSPGQ